MNDNFARRLPPPDGHQKSLSNVRACVSDLGQS